MMKNIFKSTIFIVSLLSIASAAFAGEKEFKEAVEKCTKEAKESRGFAERARDAVMDRVREGTSDRIREHNCEIKHVEKLTGARGN